MIAAFLREIAVAIRAIWNDRGARSTMLGATLFFSVFFPQPYLSEVVRDMPVAVIDQDGSTLSRELIRRIDAADAVAVTRYAADMPSARKLFLTRQIHGIIVVPPQFERDLLAGRAAPIAASSFRAVITAPSMASRMRSACPQWRAYSSIMCTSTHRNDRRP